MVPAPRRLTLVRHAHAEKHGPDREDFERRLDRRGRHEAAAIAAVAAGRALAPDHLVASPAERAIATAKEIAKAVGFPLHRIRHDDRTYLAEPGILLAILRHAPPGARHVMLVGHNPGISLLAGTLADAPDLGELPTAAMVQLEFPGSWRALDRGTCRLLGIESPERD